MRMEHRRPRATRFEADNPEVRLARLREQAPTLESSRRLRFMAVMGSVLVLLTVAAFGWTIRIYRAAVEAPRGPDLIEVEAAPELLPDVIDEALERVESEVAEAEAAQRAELEALRAVDLLREESAGAAGATGRSGQ